MQTVWQAGAYVCFWHSLASSSIPQESTVIHCLTAVFFSVSLPCLDPRCNSTHRASWRFSWKKKKKKMPTEPWADRFASKKHQNSITGPEINRLSLLQFDLFTYFMSKTHKTKLQWNHNWIWLLIQLCVSGFSWTSSWTPVSSFSSSSVQYPVYNNQCKH